MVITEHMAILPHSVRPTYAVLILTRVLSRLQDSAERWVAAEWLTPVRTVQVQE
jgi:hypothetical protein